MQCTIDKRVIFFKLKLIVNLYHFGNSDKTKDLPRPQLESSKSRSFERVLTEYYERCVTNLEEIFLRVTVAFPSIM